ncbi:MAG: co-chaperone DjlA [Halanaerobiales bacterium]|nr:co-chaperone DjlA [Halanaerobiales bacterium]
MSWTGKLFGGGLGFVLGGPIGAIIGAVVGNQFDRTADNSSRQKLNQQERLNMVFFTTTFSMLAKFAQADGNVSRSEIDVVDSFVKNDLRLESNTRQLAINIFDQAKKSNSSFEDFARQFYTHFRNEKTLLISMIDLLIKVAIADSNFDQKERKYLKKAKKIFSISDSEYESILARYNQTDSLDKYFKILEVSPDTSMEEIKRQYKKKAKDFHPDNVIGKGLPDEYREFAQNKFKEIQKAYQKIKEYKKEY